MVSLSFSFSMVCFNRFGAGPSRQGTNERGLVFICPSVLTHNWAKRAGQSECQQTAKLVVQKRGGGGSVLFSPIVYYIVFFYLFLPHKSKSVCGLKKTSKQRLYITTAWESVPKEMRFVCHFETEAAHTSPCIVEYKCYVYSSASTCKRNMTHCVMYLCLYLCQAILRTPPKAVPGPVPSSFGTLFLDPPAPHNKMPYINLIASTPMLSGPGRAGGTHSSVVRAVDTDRAEDSGSIPLVPEGCQKPLLNRTAE
jgi:hypothetical protein